MVVNQIQVDELVMHGEGINTLHISCTQRASFSQLCEYEY